MRIKNKNMAVSFKKIGNERYRWERHYFITKYHGDTDIKNLKRYLESIFPSIIYGGQYQYNVFYFTDESDNAYFQLWSLSDAEVDL